MKNHNGKYKPSSTHKYFIYDALGDGFTYFDNELERNDFYVFIKAEYLDLDGWGEGIDDIVIGVLTGVSAITNTIKLVNGCDSNGEYYNSDYDELIEYGIVEL